MKRTLFVVLLMVLALPAQAHTESQLEDWLEAHDQIDETISVTLAPRDRGSVDLEALSERVLEDMRSRHPCSRVLETWEEDRCSRPDPVTHADPSPAPAPAPSGNTGMGSNVEQWRGLVAAYFPASEVDRALCIMSHESGGNPNAKNPRSSAAGLFQVMGFWWEHYGGDRYDPETNVRVARAVWDQQGWGGWSPWNRGLCR